MSQSLSQFQPIKSLLLIGPSQTKPCGIGDYVHALKEALSDHISTTFIEIDAALHENKKELPLSFYDAILIHYEPSLVPDLNFLVQVRKKTDKPIWLVPHEVHEANPWAYSEAKLSSSFFLLQLLKKMKYRWSHRDWFQEKALQRRGYDVHYVIPLCKPNYLTLQKLRCPNLLPVIPLALPKALGQSRDESSNKIFDNSNLPSLRKVGLFGFLSEANDYSLVLRCAAAIEDIQIIIVGGSRSGNLSKAKQIQEEAATLGIADRVTITGHLSEHDLAKALSACEAFVCPFHFRSNSASILRLAEFEKPILCSKIPLTQYLGKEGLDLNFYQNEAGLIALLTHFPEAPKHCYKWTLNEVALAYIQQIQENG